MKKRPIQRVKEHKLLGTWFDESGNFMINIVKRKQKLQFMISTTKSVGSFKNVGYLAVEARLKLGEAVVLPSFLYNAEAFPSYSQEEIKELERVQGNMLRQFLEVPSTTPYYGLLMETGWLTMEARLDYKKLMLFHNIMNSDEKRVVKKILAVQREENREGTWYTNTRKIVEKYDIGLDAELTIKSKWKREVKLKIRERTEEMIKKECEKLTKTRTVRNEAYELKNYLKVLPVGISRKILLYRLHMIQIPMNYKNNWGILNCPLCGDKDSSTEHYFSCKQTEYLRNVWEVTSIDEQEPNKMKNIAHFMEGVQILLEPKHHLPEKKK